MVLKNRFIVKYVAISLTGLALSILSFYFFIVAGSTTIKSIDIDITYDLSIRIAKTIQEFLRIGRNAEIVNVSILTMKALCDREVEILFLYGYKNVTIVLPPENPVGIEVNKSLSIVYIKPYPKCSLRIEGEVIAMVSEYKWLSFVAFITSFSGIGLMISGVVLTVLRILMKK